MQKLLEFGRKAPRMEDSRKIWSETLVFIGGSKQTFIAHCSLEQELLVWVQLHHSTNLTKQP